MVVLMSELGDGYCNSEGLEQAWAKFREQLSPEDEKYFKQSDVGLTHYSSPKRYVEVLFEEMGWRQFPGIWSDSDTPDSVRDCRIEFLDEYLSRLPEDERELIQDHLGSAKSFSAIAAEQGYKFKSTPHQKFQRAIRDLVRLIALDDPDFEDTGLRNRDYDKEVDAAIRVAGRVGVIDQD